MYNVITVSFSDLDKRTNLLRYINTKKAIDLTPRSRKMYKIASDLRRTARRLNFATGDLREKIKRMQKIPESPEFLRAKLNRATYDFVMSQLRCQSLQPKGRRYTLDEKIFFLSFLKQSPKGYQLLRKFFAVPSRRTLTNLLGKLPFTTGINKVIMDSISMKTKLMKEHDKFCSIIFDEMNLDTILQFNRKNDIVDGFQDNGAQDRKPVIADKVMVFMARGICKKWKQPLAYYFNEGAMKSDVLVKSIKDVVQSCQVAGLKVKTLVCDQGTANVTAFNKLYAETREYFLARGEVNKLFGILISNQEVIPIYDPPHLLKGMRNNFFKYPLHFKWRQNKIETAKWEHIKQLYEAESMEDDDYKLCKNLTNNHINNVKKMKVSIAAQIFSNNVAAVMKRMAVEHTENTTKSLPKEAESTAELLLFMDKVFDSVNGSSVTPKHGKQLRCAVTKVSNHREFWIQAITVFNTMEFFNDKKNKIVPPSLKNWLHTLKAFVYLWDQLQKEGVQFLCTRNINQDPLENFFGSIRSHGVRNVNPNAASFINSFKSLIINNMLSNHSLNSNCEKDDLEGLDNLKTLLITPTEQIQPKVTFPEVTVEEYQPNHSSLLRKGKLTYVAGFVAKKILKQVKICQQCRKDLVGGDRSQPEYFVVQARAYSPQALLAPSTNFNSFFQKCIFHLTKLLPQICFYNNVTGHLKIILRHLCADNFFNCELHNLKELIIKYIINFHLYVWIKNVNRILKGKQSAKNTTDKIKVYASKKFAKRQKYLKKIGVN